MFEMVSEEQYNFFIDFGENSQMYVQFLGDVFGAVEALVETSEIEVVLPS